MASSENLSHFDAWNFRPAFPDSWISEAYARDTDVLTKALQKSLSNSISVSDGLTSDCVNPFLPTSFSNPETPTPVSCSSDPETAAPKPRHRNTASAAAVPGATGKVSKRKSRASSKRSHTTFITADPANFRQMVQQVTGGVRFTDTMVPVLKPEPQRFNSGSRVQGPSGGGGCLPTLDTSAFLLDHHHQIQQQQTVSVSPTSGGGGGPVVGPGPLSFSQAVMADSGAGVGAGGLDFDTFSSFPTLESWKVM